jgi:hypothetical protein
MLSRSAFPLLDTSLVNVLAANDAIRDVFRGRDEVFLADTTFFEGATGTGLRKFAVLLELGLEEGGGAAYQVLVDCEALVDIGDSEAHDLAAEAVRNISENFVLHGRRRPNLMGPSFRAAPRVLEMVILTLDDARKEEERSWRCYTPYIYIASLSPVR